MITVQLPFVEAGAAVPSALAGGPAHGLKNAREKGSGALGIGSIRAQTRTNSAVSSDLQKHQNSMLFEGVRAPKHWVEIHPSGVIVRYDSGQPKKAPKGGIRGEIEGFSDKASRRLKEFCVRHEVPGAIPVSVTFTTHRLLNANEWRKVMKRMRMRVLREDWAGIWRVELQRRKTPHLHASLWLPEELVSAGRWMPAVRDAWLECTGETNDPDARRVAVRGRVIDGPGWAVYMALHDGKHKAEQLGWLGKQWGVWNREKFKARQPSCWSGEIPDDDHRLLLRIWTRWERAQKRARIAFLLRRVGEGKCTPDEVREHLGKVRSLRRGLRRSLPEGGFMRCVEGRHVDALFVALRSGRISYARDALSAAVSRPMVGPKSRLPSEETYTW